jgi:anti-sigma factor RsiW
MAILCADIDALCPAYLDGELGGHELDDLEHHVAGCPGCRVRVEQDRTALAALRLSLRAPRAPAALRRDLGALLDREDRATAAGGSGWRWVLPGAASMAAAAALALFVLDTGRPPTSALSPLSVSAVQHDAVASRFRGAPLVAVSSRSEVARSVGEYLQVPVTAPRFTASDTNLRGWQPTRLAGRIAAKLVYEVTPTRGGGRYLVDVHILDGRDIALDGSERVVSDGTEIWVTSTFGINTVAYKDRKGVGYVVISEMPRGQLIDLVLEPELLQNATHQVFGE